MNAATDYSRALYQAKADAKTNGKPRYVFAISRKWHITMSPPRGGVYIRVNPDGSTRTIHPN